MSRLIYTRELRVAARNQLQRAILARQDLKLRSHCIWPHDYEDVGHKKEFNRGIHFIWLVNVEFLSIYSLLKNRQFSIGSSCPRRNVKCSRKFKSDSLLVNTVKRNFNCIISITHNSCAYRTWLRNNVIRTIHSVY